MTETTLTHNDTGGPLNPFEVGYLDGELAQATRMDYARATAYVEMSFDHDPLYALGFGEGYGALHALEAEYAHHKAGLDIAWHATARWGETTRRVPTRREVRQARKAHRTHR